MHTYTSTPRKQSTDRAKKRSGAIERHSRSAERIASYSSAQIAQLQRSAGNRAVAQLLKAKSSPAAPVQRKAGVVQRVAVTLFDGLDKDKPSTYDVGGGHSYADHGAHTTEEQQRERLKSGTAPSGRVSKVPPGKPATKFSSDDKHKAAFHEAYDQLVAKNAPKKNLVGMGGTIGVAGAGIGYLRDGTTIACDKVQLDIQPADGKLRINTMFPVG